MEKATSKESNRSNSIFGFESHGHQGPRGQRHRVARLWVDHLYSQIWRGSPRRTELLLSPLHADDVAGGHVLDGYWWWQRRGSRGRRDKAYRRGLVCSACLLTALLFTGCHRPDWKERYSSAVTEFRNGNSEAALVLVGNLPVSPDANANIWYWRLLRSQGATISTAESTCPGFRFPFQVTNSASR